MINRPLKAKERLDLLPDRSGMAWVVDDKGKGIWLPADPNDPFENPFANFTEWDSEADHKAYDKL
ncbi:hypothetical protein [Aureimonas psammosilenae]|uniref:hypothetical protein n=1 Tax=Aureimonas psammosilenae TaxID=2495496 RepID=UPI0012604CC4|nr:hypothetical protein [Aureimonas psammosilenae]